MKNLITSIVYLMVIFSIPVSAYGDELSGLRESIQAVREKLVILLVTTDKAKQTTRIQDIKHISDDIDMMLKALFENKKIPEETKKNLTEFQSIWTAFRTTRDAEIIPRLLSGDEEKNQRGKNHRPHNSSRAVSENAGIASVIIKGSAYPEHLIMPLRRCFLDNSLFQILYNSEHF